VGRQTAPDDLLAGQRQTVAQVTEAVPVTLALPLSSTCSSSASSITGLYDIVISMSETNCANSSRLNGVGCGIAAGGLLLSGVGALLCYANALTMDGASKDVSLAGYVALLAGAALAIVGSVLAVTGRAKSTSRTSPVTPLS
jgi:hypothetical protein